MSRVTKPPQPLDNFGELLNRLGGIPASRVRLDPPPGRATKRDLVRLHNSGDKLYELVDGTLVEKPMGSPESFVAGELGFHLRSFLALHDLGYMYTTDALIELLPRLVRGPDVCFTSWDKRPERTVPGNKQISDLIPDLVVEVLSPKNTRGEIARKLKEYFLAGVALVWVIDPKTRAADVYTTPDVKTAVPPTGTLDGGEVLPGFRLPLAKLFERLEKPTAKKPRKKK
jgi:Uma2 family endonuclease